MAETALGGVIDFLTEFGFFDVILPFLLVFTIVFGILEKTKIFGTEEYHGKEVPKKNLNAMVAFSIAFFFVAAKEIVVGIQESLPMVALILIAIVSFLMLVGAFASGNKEGFDFYSVIGDNFKGPFAIVFILSIVLIFFQGFGWLEPIYNYFSSQGNDVFIIIVFFLITGGIIKFVFDGGSPKED